MWFLAACETPGSEQIVIDVPAPDLPIKNGGLEEDRAQSSELLILSEVPALMPAFFDPMEVTEDTPVSPLAESPVADESTALSTQGKEC